MTVERVIIWGATGPARIVEDILRLGGKYEIAGYLDNLRPERKGESFGGATVLGGEEVLDDLLQKGVTNIIFSFANGPIKLKLTETVRAKGFKLITAIHPMAAISSNAHIGAGTIIRSHTSIGPDTQVGENCIFSYGVNISHDCVVGDGVHISSGVTVAGGVRIGRNAWIAIGANVIDNRTIGENALIGAGSTVVRDIPNDVVAYGSPAKVIRSRS